jgi:hypothetical protein
MKKCTSILFQSLVDYAGLFPPAALPLRETLQNYVTYIGGNDSPMLGRLILPVTQLQAAEDLLCDMRLPHSIPVSCLISKSVTVAESRTRLGEAVGIISAFRNDPKAVIDPQVIEMALPEDVTDGISELELGGYIHQVQAIMDDVDLTLPVFLEPMLSGDTLAVADSLTAVLDAHNHAGYEPRLGWKLRCGGISKEAFPSSETLSKFIIAAARHSIPLKATAGLHHPFPIIDPVTGARMHGFVNLIAAMACAIRYPSDRQPVVDILNEDDSSNFLIGDLGLHWRDHMFSLDRLKKARTDGLLSFGSCSFDEPRDDLRNSGIKLDFSR